MQNLLRARAVIKRQLPSAWVALVGVGTFDYPLRKWSDMIPPFAPLLKQMDGIAFQAMRPRPAGSIIQNSTVSDPGNPEQIRQCCEVFSHTANP